MSSCDDQLDEFIISSNNKDEVIESYRELTTDQNKTIKEQKETIRTLNKTIEDIKNESIRNLPVSDEHEGVEP